MIAAASGSGRALVGDRKRPLDIVADGGPVGRQHVAGQIGRAVEPRIVQPGAVGVAHPDDREAKPEALAQVGRSE